MATTPSYSGKPYWSIYPSAFWWHRIIPTEICPRDIVQKHKSNNGWLHWLPSAEPRQRFPYDVLWKNVGVFFWDLGIVCNLCHNFRNQSAMEILSKMYGSFFRIFRPGSVNVNWNLNTLWFFYPLKQKDSFQIEALRGLSDFDANNFLPAPIDFSKVKEHGTVFEFLNGLVQQADIRGLEPILTSKMMQTLAEHLGSITHRLPMNRYSLVQEVMARLNEFSYSYLDNPLFKLKDLYMERLCPTNVSGWYNSDPVW